MSYLDAGRFFSENSTQKLGQDMNNSKNNPIPAWRQKAACRGVDPGIFYPVSDEDAEDAKLICAQCDVSELCLQWALDHREHEGVWGGTTERERRRIIRRRRRSA